MQDLLKNTKKLLLMKLRYIGDSIWMLPVINNLKWNYPHLKLSVLVNEGTEDFFYLNPLVDEVLTFPRKKVKSRFGFLRFLKFIKKIRKKNFDTVIDLTDADRPALISFLSGAKIRISYDNEHKPRRFLYTHKVNAKINKKHMVEYHLDLLKELGIKIHDTSIKIQIPDHILNNLYQRFPQLHNTKRKLLIHPGARNPLRQWGTKNFAKVISAVKDKYDIILIAAPNETHLIKDIISQINFKPLIATTELNLIEFAGICKICDLYLGNDTGPLHIAAAVGTFVIGIFGPTFSHLAGPWTERKIIFEAPADLKCRGCYQEFCLNQEYKACLKTISPKVIISAILNLTIK
ncbi:MAG TPA: glycosyltransferase family 9 protein [Candidatus Desulfofervidus auxilii]|uniref:Glycosyltransferase family 9 protein n=1 Tax=Desulfofervidus auxilii TaxID=1621989 RepID=A0A7C0Y8Z1_DESA2|nr:glycosyltransferase family 9 protein [Candidatus Desulfofervidus auxilii]